MSTARVPKSVLLLTAASMIICLPMIALSVVNFGLLSIGLNAALAFLILIHHFSFYVATWFTRKPNPAKIHASTDDLDDFAQLLDEPSIALHLGNIAVLSFLTMLNIVAFAIMIDITTRGPIRSTLPIERIGSHKWNIKVQIGQTCVLGAELLMLGLILAICGLGRRRFNALKEDQEEIHDYGLA